MKTHTHNAKSADITKPGFHLVIVSETPFQATMEVVGLFFPVHQVSWGESQISKERQEYLKKFFIGHKMKFWMKGKITGQEVGGRRVLISDSDYSNLKF